MLQPFIDLAQVEPQPRPRPGTESAHAELAGMPVDLVNDDVEVSRDRLRVDERNDRLR